MNGARRPNVIVFFTDQQRWDTCGCYGANPMNLTPVLDRMASRGTRFESAFTVQPVCGPARACLQTGKYATRTGCWCNGLGLPPDEPTLARWFGAAGYLTAYIGKWHLAGTDGSGEHGLVPPELRGGYEYWLAANILEFVSRPYDLNLYDGNGKKVHRPGYRVDAQTDLALDFLRERSRDRGRPFFLFLSYLEPHFQNDMKRFVAPDGYAERLKRNLWVPPDLAPGKGDWEKELPDYYGMCARLDEHLGRLVTTMEETGLAENTVVLFTSDHGCHFCTRNGEYKRSCHESSIRIPAVAWGPGFDGGRVVQNLVSIIDFTPTLLDTAGVAVPGGLDGRSVMPLVRGRDTAWRDEIFIQISESQVGRALRTGRWKYGINAPRKNGWKTPSSAAYVEQYLYDLEADPHELDNLAGRTGTRTAAAELRHRLVRRMAEAGESAPRISPAPATLSRPERRKKKRP